MTKHEKPRVLARDTAQELTREEVDLVAAGGPYEAAATWTGCDSSGCSDGDC
jgi:hypothetical protein